jgi:hypothetical protein
VKDAYDEGGMTWGTAGILSIVWMFKPPSSMKPRWLRDVESGRPSDEVPTVVLGAPAPGGSRRIYVPQPFYGALWALTAAVFVSWIVFDWSPGVLVGVGSAISSLVVMTPRK